MLTALQPGLKLRVNPTNQVTGNGQQSAATLEMLALDQGGAIIDTQGEFD